MWGVHVQCMCGGACAMCALGVHMQCVHGGAHTMSAWGACAVHMWEHTQCMHRGHAQCMCNVVSFKPSAVKKSESNILINE